MISGVAGGSSGAGSAASGSGSSGAPSGGAAGTGGSGAPSGGGPAAPGESTPQEVPGEPPVTEEQEQQFYNALLAKANQLSGYVGEVNAAASAFNGDCMADAATRQRHWGEASGLIEKLCASPVDHQLGRVQIQERRLHFCRRRELVEEPDPGSELPGSWVLGASGEGAREAVPRDDAGPQLTFELQSAFA